MVSKDQAIGGAILAVCLIVAIGYAVLVIFPAEIYGLFGQTVTSSTGNTIRLYAVLIPVLIAFLAILFIGAWIGWTMATTPPPKPIEEITTEIEEKKEEPVATPPEASVADEKAAKKKK
jgi:predicted DNA-binding transcriptional regulator